MAQLFSPDLYLHTVHGYYGTLRVPPVGLIGVLMPLVVIAAALRTARGNLPGWRLICLILAGLLAAFASSALLLTNNEIAYVTFAASLVIAIGLWLGFDLRPRGAGFAAGVVLPALLLAAAGWESAWQGQRSQFGHDGTPRESYARGQDLGPDFHYLHGLRLPQSLANSLGELAQWRRRLPKDDARRVFYGPGLEWLEHVWPARKVRGLPLVTAAFDGETENTLLEREVIGGDTFRHLVALEAWDHWNASVQDRLTCTTMKQRIGTGIMAYRKLPAGTVSAQPLEFLFGGLGSNVDSLRIITPLPMHPLTGGRRYLGIDRGEGRVDIQTPCRRMSAEYVLERITADHSVPLTAHVAIAANLAGTLLPRWQADVTLPAGQDLLAVRTDAVDGSGQPLTFTVMLPPTAAGRLRAGWRAFQLTDTADNDAGPPMLQSGAAALADGGERVRQAALAGELRTAPTFVRRGFVADGRLLLPAGGELWVKLDGLFADIPISVRLDHPRHDPRPPLQVVYYKGGRLQHFQSVYDQAAGTLTVQAWSPENGGWLGLLADPEADPALMAVQIGASRRR